MNSIFHRAVKWALQRVPTRTLKNNLLLGIFKIRGHAPQALTKGPGDSAVMVGTPNTERVHQFADLVGENGSALFIEPEPNNHERLQRAATEYTNVTVDDRGAWSESAVQELLLAAESNPADHKVSVEGIEHDNDYRDENYVESTEIQVEPLDTILSEHGITPDYVEVMVNGAELKVLEGATETLANAKPRLLVKGHAREEETGKPINRQVAAMLEEYGYNTVIGAGKDPTVGDTDDWERRDGDVYAW